MKTAVYGGSFNPPHLGHVAAARSVYQWLRPDIFYIIPAGTPPHKAVAQDSPDGAARLHMCALAFGDIPGVTVSDMELRRQGKSYTVDTLEALRAARPGDELFLVIGSDMFLSFREWYRYRDILRLCTLAVLSREEDDAAELERFRLELEQSCGAAILMAPHEPLPMSSSDARLMLLRGRGADMLPEPVYSYITENRLYDSRPELDPLRDRVYSRLDAHRAAHTAGCESEAVRLAERWGGDRQAAAEAGILHDVTKNLSYDDQLILCEKYGIILKSGERDNPKLLHAITGAAVAGDEFGASGEICAAIRRHTTGRPDMTLLQKIIYLADFIEPTRDFPGVGELRKLAYEDIDLAMARALEMSLEEIRAGGKEPFRDTVEAFLWYNAKRGDNKC